MCMGDLIDRDEVINTIEGIREATWGATQEDIRSMVEAFITDYVHKDYRYVSDTYPYKAAGLDAINLEIKDAITLSVKSVIADNLEDITTRAIQSTAMSIRNNPKYKELQNIIAGIVVEEEQKHENMRVIDNED